MENLTYKEALESLVSMVHTPIMQRKNPDLYEVSDIVKEKMNEDKTDKTVYAVCPLCDDAAYGYMEPEFISSSYEDAYDYCWEKLHYKYKNGDDCKIAVEAGPDYTEIYNVTEWSLGTEHEIAGSIYKIVKFEI